MCTPKTPKYETATVETPVYAKETPDVEEAPTLAKDKDDKTTTGKANRRGFRQLRTDLPDASKNRSGLNIPT